MRRSSEVWAYSKRRIEQVGQHLAASVPWCSVTRTRRRGNANDARARADDFTPSSTRPRHAAAPRDATSGCGRAVLSSDSDNTRCLLAHVFFIYIFTKLRNILFLAKPWPSPL